MAIAIEKVGGARRYEDNLWKSLAFITRYGHQSLKDTLELEEDDRNSYMQALGDLIREENTPTGG